MHYLRLTTEYIIEAEANLKSITEHETNNIILKVIKPNKKLIF
jgi:hypothetical protein